MDQAFSMKVETDLFNKHIKQFLKKSNISVEKGIKKFAFDLLNRIIKKNPVDTGRSRAAWYVAIEKLGGAISVSTKEEREGYSKGKFIDHTKNFLDKYIEIVNGVDYVIYLEYGSSKQAPYGMVRLSMRELRKGKLPQDLSKQLQKDWNEFYV